MIVAFSWRGNNSRQQRFDLTERDYINPIIIIIVLSFVISPVIKIISTRQQLVW